MKTSHLIPYLMTIAVITGCIKEDGEPFTIERQIHNNNIESSQKGYMYGTAQKDSIVENTFQTVIKANDLEDLDVYISLSSVYDTIDVSRNAIKQCGYVLSETNNTPTVGGEGCTIFDQKLINWKGDTTSTSLTFSGEHHGLAFNHNYFVRSYVVTTQGDTCYNPQVSQIKTVIPSNVWFRRNDANIEARTEAISATTDNGLVYVYGGRGNMACYSDMWVYDSKNDTWQQKATFNPDEANSHVLPVERCNGAAFMSYFALNNDTLMYILGGENFNGDPTKHNFIYSLKQNRYSNGADHPQKRLYVEPFDQPRTGLVAFTINSPGGEPFHCVGMGYLQIEGTSVRSVEPKIFNYEVGFDRLNMVLKEGTEDEYEDDGKHVHTWHTLGSLSKDGKTAIDQTAIGFYQAVAVQINKTTAIVGSGEGSDDKYSNAFYQLSISNTLDLDMKKLPSPPAEFTPRKNAAAFYLNYTKDASEHDKFFVGTGCDASGELLNDFWAYDFSKGTWERIADCGNVYREGAVGFKVLRVDDYFVKEFAEPQERGIVAFGKGIVPTINNPSTNTNDASVKKDVWEYLP